MATIGPSSPYAPWFIRVAPNLVAIRPLSLRIGNSVPSAVEVSAIATAISASTASVEPSSADDRDSASPREASPGPECSATPAADQLLDLDLVARQEEQHAEPELAQHPDALVGDREVERRGGR